MDLKQVSIKRISYKLAYKITKEKNQPHSQKYKYYYLLQVIIGGLLTFSAILIASYILGVFKEGLICSIVFTSLRFFAGGFHADTYLKCLIFSVLLIPLTAFISHYMYLFNFYTLITNIIIFIFSIIIFVIYSPCSNRNIQIITLDKKNKLLKKAIYTNTFWFLLSSYFLLGNKCNSIAPVIGMSSLIVALLVIACINKNLIKVNNCVI